MNVSEPMLAPQRTRVQASPTRREVISGRFRWPDLLLSLGTGSDARPYHPNEVVYGQGDSADAVYYIAAGRIALSVLSARGKQAIVAIPGAGEFFGEGALAAEANRSASAIAVEETDVICVQKATMQRLLRDVPAACDRFLGFLLSRNLQLQADLVDHFFNSSERRLARVLLGLAGLGGNGDLEAVVPRMRQDTLAARVGTTRARISRFMTKFRRLGYIDYEGGLKIRASLRDIITDG